MKYLLFNKRNKIDTYSCNKDKLIIMNFSKIYLMNMNTLSLLTPL